MNSHKTPYSLLRKNFRNSLNNLLIFLHLKLRKTGNNLNRNKVQTEKMNHPIGQTSSKRDTHSDELHLAVLTQQNKCLQGDISPFEVKHYPHQEQ